MSAFNAYVKLVGWSEDVPYPSELFDKIMGNMDWVLWLTRHGFVGMSEKKEYYRCGTMFHIAGGIIDSKIHPLYEKFRFYIEARTNLTPSLLADDGGFWSIAHVFVLVHQENRKKYLLVNLATGYNLVHGAVYERKEEGIEIPAEHLMGLFKMREGYGK